MTRYYKREFTGEFEKEVITKSFDKVKEYLECKGLINIPGPFWHDTFYFSPEAGVYLRYIHFNRYFSLHGIVVRVATTDKKFLDDMASEFPNLKPHDISQVD